MDKRRTWREQEQQLVERWNAATERCRETEAEVTRQRLPQGDGAPSEECARFSALSHSLLFAHAVVPLETASSNPGRI